jgi:hypothetical protein
MQGLHMGGVIREHRTIEALGVGQASGFVMDEARRKNLLGRENWRGAQQNTPDRDCRRTISADEVRENPSMSVCF